MSLVHHTRFPFLRTLVHAGFCMFPKSCDLRTQRLQDLCSSVCLICISHDLAWSNIIISSFASTQNAEWRKMFGAEESEATSIDNPPPSKASTLSVTKAAGDTADGKKASMATTHSAPGLVGSGGGGGGREVTPSPLTMEPTIPSGTVVAAAAAVSKVQSKSGNYNQKKFFLAHVSHNGISTVS
jgi:hypothetical protein